MQVPLFSFIYKQDKSGESMNDTDRIVGAESDDEKRRKIEEWLARYRERRERTEKLLKKARENPRVLTPEIEAEVDAKVKEKVGTKRYLGYCHAYWGCKKDILLVEYGIDWKSPQELNPDCFYD